MSPWPLNLKDSGHKPDVGPNSLPEWAILMYDRQRTQSTKFWASSVSEWGGKKSGFANRLNRVRAAASLRECCRVWGNNFHEPLCAPACGCSTKKIKLSSGNHLLHENSVVNVGIWTSACRQENPFCCNRNRTRLPFIFARNENTFSNIVLPAKTYQTHKFHTRCCDHLAEVYVRAVARK